MTKRRPRTAVSARPGRRPDPAQRIRGPGELLQAVPYLLGFHPQHSIVLVGLRDGRLVVTARLDLADVRAASRSGVDLAVQTLEQLCAGGASEIIAAIYADPVVEPADTHTELVSRLQAAAGRLRCMVIDILLVGPERWWSLCCEVPGCCDPAGMPLPDVASAYAAAATVEGIVPLPDRAALVALLDPLPDAERDALVPLIDAARRDATTVERARKRALFAAARRVGEPPGPMPDDATAAGFGVALRTSTIRDSLWLAVDDRRLDGRALWRELARRLPAPFDSAPAFLYGWASWRAGNGALARIAAERAIASDPSSSAADMLLAALAHGLDPHTFPRLRRPA